MPYSRYRSLFHPLACYPSPIDSQREAAVSYPFINTDIQGELILLGTGTSVGVPTIGCGCTVCQSADPRNQRTRCSLLLGLPEGNLLVDTSPDLRTQLLRERIGLVHAVLYTHEHAVHLLGLDDVRLFPFRLGHAVPLYCEPVVRRRIERTFDYAFSNLPHTHAGADAMRQGSTCRGPREAASFRREWRWCRCNMRYRQSGSPALENAVHATNARE